MVRLIKQVLIVLLSLSGSLASVVDADHVKRVSLNNQQYMIQTTLINLHPNEYVARLRYYPFAVNPIVHRGGGGAIPPPPPTVGFFLITFFSLTLRA